MQTNNLKYLKFVRFKEVEQWYVSYYLNNNKISSKYPLIYLRNLITPIKNLIKKDDYNGVSPIVEKIVFKTGEIVFRNENKTGMNLYSLKQNDLLISNINFHQGATALNTFGDIVASTHYQPYKVNFKLIIPEYLIKVLRTPTFLNIVSGKKAQGIKNESGYSFIASFSFPLPTLAEQESLVSAYNSKIAEAEAKETEAGRKSTEIEEYLLYELGIQKDEPNSNKTEESEGYLRFVRFKDVDRWDCYNDSECKVKSKYSNVPLSKIIIGKPMYGAAYKAVKKISNIRYIRITDINEDGSLNNDFVTVDKYENQYLLKQDDFLIARTGNTVGKTFLYDKKYGDAIFAGYLIKFVLNQKMVNPHFLLLYTKSSLFKEWINGNMRVSAQPNINSQQYSNCPIVLPPLEIQNTIVAHISEQKEQVKQLKQEAKELRERALKDFENEIFG